MEQISTERRIGNGTGDAVLLLGFGGPESMSEVGPFLKSILTPPFVEQMTGRPPVSTVPPERLRKIEARYASVRGFSPFCGEARQFAAYLETLLGDLGTPMSVFCANLYSRPTLDDVLEKLWQTRESSTPIRRIFVQVLTPFGGYYAYDKYIESLKTATSRFTKAHPSSVPFFETQVTWQILPILCTLEGYVEAVAESVVTAFRAIPDGHTPRLLFTAHSVPVDMPGVSDYHRQVLDLATSVVSTLSVMREQNQTFDGDHPIPYDVAWQSRTGRPSQPWLEPTPTAVVESAGCGSFFWLVVPIGFLFENLELTFDLDQEVATTVLEHGGKYGRVSAVGSSTWNLFAPLNQPSAPNQPSAVGCRSADPLSSNQSSVSENQSSATDVVVPTSESPTGSASPSVSQNRLTRIVARSILSRYRGV